MYPVELGVADGSPFDAFDDITYSPFWFADVESDGTIGSPFEPFSDCKLPSHLPVESTSETVAAIVGINVR